MSGKTYKVNEVFYSIQGEGLLAGTAMVFVRFSRCNMECRVEPGPRSPGGFDCDTEFESGRRVGLQELQSWMNAEAVALGAAGSSPKWALLTGGEPGLQLDDELLRGLRASGWQIAVETNGSVLLPHARDDLEAEHVGAASVEGVLSEFFPLFDHITVSPKVAEHAIRQRWAHEVRYVRASGQALPETNVRAMHRFISPACHGDAVDQRAVEWCSRLILADPSWRLSVQAHKRWSVR